MDESEGKFWSGRFLQPPHELFEQLNASIGFDWRLAPYDIQASIAHARMLAKSSIISEEELRQIDDGMMQIMSEIATGDFSFELSDEDIHSAIEKRLIAIIGESGKKLHTARSRNDQVATDLALYVRDQINQHLSDLTSLLGSLLQQAGNNQTAILPGYTHLQRAQPVLLAHHLLAYFEMFSRDFGRLLQARAGTMVMPLGAGALAGVNYATDRQMTADELGFDHPGRNSIDDVSNRDFALDYLYAAALLGVHMSRLAGELILWSSAEFGFAEISDAFTSGSSIMPQKKNADACELIRAKASKFSANLQALTGLMTGLPLAYNKDMQEDKIYVFETSDTLLLTLPVMAEMIATIEFDHKRMWSAAEESFTMATDVADYLVAKGVPFRDAHRITGQLVRKCIDEQRLLDAISVDELRALSGVFDEDYRDVVDLEKAVERKNSFGGTSPEQVSLQLHEAHKRLNGMRVELQTAE